MKSIIMTLALIALQATAGAQESLPSRRAQVERMIQQRFAAVVRRELGLGDAQMRQLVQANRAIDADRRALLRRERSWRQALRTELSGGATANQARVDSLLVDLQRAQRDRLDLHEREDRELRTFLTPVQRAKYFALQEQLRQRVQQLTRELNGARADSGRRGRPSSIDPLD